jgi:hypothetical protein
MARNMAWHFWPTAAAADSVLVPEMPDADSLDYWRGLGFSLPEFRVHPDPGRLFTAFGWNAEAAGREKEYVRVSPHPDPALTARVNGRKFGLQLENELFPEAGSGGVFLEDVSTLETWLAERHPGRWVAKGNHGHGGIGQLRFDLEKPWPDLPRLLGRLLNDQAGLLMEPEQALQIEFGLLFLLRPDGSTTRPRRHRLLSRAGGGFAGALYLPEDSEYEALRPEAEKAMAALAARLHGEGYFGPVSVDAYVHREGGRMRFRPLVDLNARCSMAYPVHGLARRLPDRVIWLSQLSTRILSLPKTLGELKKALGPLHFNPASGTGVFWITPLINGLRRQGMACVGNTLEDTEAMRRQLLQKLSHA